MTRKEFLQKTEREHNIFFAKVMHAAKSYDLSWEHIEYAVVMAEKKGCFNTVKFGSEVYQENDALTVID